MLAVASERLSRKEKESLCAFRGATVEYERGSPPGLGPRDSFFSASRRDMRQMIVGQVEARRPDGSLAGELGISCSDLQRTFLLNDRI